MHSRVNHNIHQLKMYSGPSYYLWHINLFHNYYYIKGVGVLKFKNVRSENK